jgi:hypothetical protein
MSSKWERYAAVGGVWFVVLGLVAAFLPGAPPAPDDPLDKVTKFFADHDGAIRAGHVLFLFGSLGLIWWFGSLFRRMALAEEGHARLAVVAALGFLWSGIFFLASSAVLATTSLRASALGDSVYSWFALSNVLGSSSMIGLAILTGSVSALVWRVGMFPRWSAYLGSLVALLTVVGTFGAGTDAPFPFYVGFVGFLLWDVWILVVSWFLWRPATT